MSNEHKQFFHFATYIPVLFLIMLGVALSIYAFEPLHLFGSKTNLVTLVVGGALFLAGTSIVIATEIVKQPFGSIAHSQEYRDFMRGMYKYSRHPITLGFIAMFFGLGFILNSFSFILVSVVFSLMIAFIVVPRYEQAMVALSQTYDEYRKHVRRWI